ncbi:hypothetical protein LCGC14_2970610, partial [marine sediment metagenome]
YTLNLTRSILYHYSDFFRVLPYTWTDDIFFLPRSNSSKNVSAYGQTSTKPVINITATNYGGADFNLSIYVNQSFSCLNLTWDTDNTVPTGNKINTTYQEMTTNHGYLTNQSIWLWADLEQCNASDLMILSPELELESYCVNCLWVGS